jgi:hypothetical protein
MRLRLRAAMTGQGLMAAPKGPVEDRDRMRRFMVAMAVLLMVFIGPDVQP